MKRALVAGTILGMFAAVPAQAADLPVKALVPDKVWNWTGFYLGGNVGGGMGSVHFDDPCFTCSSTIQSSGLFTGGLQAGYNYQFGSGLIGLEADINGNSAPGEAVLGGSQTFALRIGLNADVSGTIRARTGLVTNNTLLYVTAGAAWANFRQRGTGFNNLVLSPNFGQPTGITANADGNLWGGVIGAGVEYALSPHWTVGGEFLHTIYRDRGATLRLNDGTTACINTLNENCAIGSQLSTSVARLRLNYRFGGDSASQVYAWSPATKVKTAAAFYDWTGFYVGANSGGGMASSYFTDRCFYCSTATPSSGYFTGGVQAGYNYQFGHGVVGFEGDVAGNSALGNSVIGGRFDPAISVGATADVSGTIRARAGVAVNNALLYVTGGAAWANVRQSGIEFDNFSLSPNFGRPTGTAANASATLWGGVIGAGVEYALSPNWTIGGEFLRTTYRDIDANIRRSDGTSGCIVTPAENCIVRSRLTTNVARLRVNYRFGDRQHPATAHQPTTTAYNWTGFYLGGSVGGGMAASAFTDPGLDFASVALARGYFTGGLQAGYNYQFGKSLIGIEADIAGNGPFANAVVMGGVDASAATLVGLEARVSGTIRARGGLVANNALLYVTAGGAWANVRQSGLGFENSIESIGSGTFGQPNGISANASGMLWGGVIGAGVEYAVSPNWTIGGEFLHTVYRDLDAGLRNNGAGACDPFTPSTNCVIRSQLTMDVVRLRLNYRFGG